MSRITTRLGADARRAGRCCAATRSWSASRSTARVAAILCAAIVTIGPGLYLIDDGQGRVGGPLAVIGYYLLAWSASTSASASPPPPT